MKNALKKVLSFTLTLALVFSLIPAGTVVTNAADLIMDSDGLTASTSGDATWTGGGSSASGTVTGTTTLSIFTSAKSGTLTFKNNKSAAAKITFDYNITKNTGSVTVGSSTITGSGSYSGEIASGGTLAVKITSGKGSGNTTAISITNITLFIDVEATATFAAVENGTYTVDGAQISTDTVKTQSAAIAYALSATPASGYKFLGWYSSSANDYLSTSSTVNVNVDANTTIYPVFVSAATSVFKVGSAYYYDLNEANAAAASGSNKTIVVFNGGTLPAGNYEISSGVKLLVPYDAAHTESFNETPNLVNARLGNAWKKPTMYSNLTIGDGAVVKCYGQINVNSQMFVETSSYTSTTTGAYGALDITANGQLVLESGATLYAYGYMGGEGTVEAKSGSKVYQMMQLADWRGGSISSGWEGNFGGNSFLFSQYYLQNIEACLKVYSGATMYAVTGLTVASPSVVSKQVSAAIIGVDSGLFRMMAENTGDYVTLKYDAATDRMNLNLYGDITTQNIAMSVSMGLGMGVDMDTANYILPLPMNYTVNVHSGSNASFIQNFKILPGTEIYVQEGANVTVSSTGSVYLYDADDWNSGKYIISGTIRQLKYVHSRKAAPVTRTVNKDALLCVDGTFNAQGPVYSTKHTANGGTAVITGNGTITFAKHGTLNLLESNNNAETGTTITCVPALGNIAGHDGFNSFATGTYYGENGVWYQYKLENEGFTVQSGGHQDGNMVYVGTTKDSAAVNLVMNTTYPCVQLTGVTSTNDGNGTYTVTAIAENAKMIAKEHTVEVYQQAVEAGCVASGSTAGTKCSVCGLILTEPTVIPALNHTYGEWVATTPGSCTTNGVDTRTCTRCGDTETRDVVAPGHSYVKIPAVAPTCDTTGLTEGEHCEICGQISIAQDEVAALGHSYDNGVVTTQPTCTDAGVKTYTCQVCNDAYTEDVAPLGHIEETLAAVAATCEAEGLSEGTKCTRCDLVLVEQTVVPAKGHNIMERVTVEATCTTAGSLMRRCRNGCGLNETVSIPATGHTDADANDVCDTCSEVLVVLEGEENTEVIYESKVVYTTETLINNPEDLIVDGETYITEVVASVKTDDGVVNYGTGTVITAVVGGETLTFTLVVAGDLNGDGVCDVLDAAMTANYSTNISTPTELEVYAATGSDTATAITVDDYAQIVNKAIA